MDKTELFSAFMYDDFDTIISKISQYLNNPIVVINNTNRIIAYTHDPSIQDQTWQNAVARGYITLEFGATLNNFNALKNEGCSYIEVDAINQHKRRFYKLKHLNQSLGYLNVMNYEHDLNDIPDSDYEFIVSILAKELSIHKNIHADKHEAILYDLIDQQFIDRQSFNEAIKNTCFEIPRPYNVLYIDFSNQGSYNADRDTYRETILSLFPGCVFAIANKKLRVLVPSEECILNQELLHLLNKLNLTVGISDSFSDLFTYKEYERQAQDALKYKYLRFDHKPYIQYDEIKTYDLINRTPSIQIYVNQTIRQIYQYDLSNQSEYAKTLYVYLTLSQSIIATSNVLFLHRNTVNYRIKTIKSLFNLQLDDPDLISEYLFSLKILFTEQAKL